MRNCTLLFASRVVATVRVTHRRRRSARDHREPVKPYFRSRSNVDHSAIAISSAPIPRTTHWITCFGNVCW